MRSPPSRTRGHYLLEAAFVVFGVSFFLVGASDVARIFHARSAVRAGVREGVRCLYPTDAACSQSIPEQLSPSLMRYNVDVWDEAASYLVRNATWSASASWMTEPELAIPLEEERISVAEVDLARDRYRIHEVLFPVQGHHPHILQQRELPLVGGSDPLAPEFRDRIFHRPVAPHKTVDLRAVSGKTRASLVGSQGGFEPQFKIGSVRFRLADAWATREQDVAVIQSLEGAHGIRIPCYAGTLVRGSAPPRLDWAASPAPAACAYRAGQQLWRDRQLYVPLMLRVSGSTRGTLRGAQGKALISIRWERGTEEQKQELGGRLIGQGGSGNFVVRGATLDDIAKSARAPYSPPGGAYHEEISRHGSVLLVPVDATVHLDAYLVSLNGGQVAWQGEALELYYPSFAFVPESVPCPLSPYPARCEQAGHPRPLFATSDAARAPTSRATDETACARTPPEGFQGDPGELFSRLAAKAARGEALQPTKFYQLDGEGPGGLCAPLRRRVQCRGAFREHLKGCQECREVEGGVALPPGCADPEFQPGRDVVVRVSCERHATGREERRLGCSAQPLPGCAAPNAQEVSRYVWNAGAGASCSRARIHSPPRLVIGPLPESKCGPSPDIEAEYRRRHQVPGQVQISVGSAPAEDSVLPQPPADPCTVSTPSYKAGPRRSCGSLLTGDAAAACCSSFSGRCSITPIRVSQAAPRSEPYGVSVERAQRRVADVVQAAYPQASWQPACSGRSPAHCLTVSATHNHSLQSVSVRAQVSVPLRLSALFGAETVTVAHSESRVLEQRFVRD